MQPIRAHLDPDLACLHHHRRHHWTPPPYTGSWSPSYAPPPAKTTVADAAAASHTPSRGRPTAAPPGLCPVTPMAAVAERERHWEGARRGAGPPRGGMAPPL
jgi:hypothetical protein